MRKEPEEEEYRPKLFDVQSRGMEEKYSGDDAREEKNIHLLVLQQQHNLYVLITMKLA